LETCCLPSGHQNIVARIVLYGQFLFSASFDSSAKQWDKNTGQLVRTFSVSSGLQITALAVSQDGLSVFTGVQDPSSYLVQWRTSDSIRLAAFEGSFYSLRYIKATQIQFLSSKYPVTIYLVVVQIQLQCNG
jgi:WD40 repeat protein